MVSLKKWMENNPAVTVLGIGISVASVAAGVTAYLLEKVNRAEKIEIANKYNTQIADLTTRLSSIERRAGPAQEKRYFDVQSMQVSVSEVRNLPNQFTNYDEGHFFLNAPITQAWNYAVLTEGEIAKLGVYRTMIEEAYKIDQMKSILDRNKTHVWYSNPIANISFNYGPSALSLKAQLISRVFIMKATRQDFAANAAAFAGIVSSPSDDTPKSDPNNAKIAIDEIQRLKQETKKDKDNFEDKSDEKLDMETHYKKVFEQLFDGDTAGLIFVDGLMRIAQPAMQSSNISFSILSAQKQLNVMYIDAETRIAGAKVEKSFDDSCKEATAATIIIRRELFFVSFGSAGYVIDAEVPTC